MSSTSPPAAGSRPAGHATVRPDAPASEQLSSEHEVLLDHCGLIDRSQRGKLALTGSGAAEFLNGQVSNDVISLETGQGCYAAFLTHKGKMLGDLRILATEDGLLLDTERVALQALFDMIRRFKIGYDVELHKRTLECALLSLIGPEARSVAAAAIGSATPLPGAQEHSHRQALMSGRQVRLIATSEPDGLDVLCRTEDAEPVRQTLIGAGARPVGEAAAELVRIESGRPRYGIDMNDEVIPQEAGLNERAVSFTKGCYVGQETVARLYYKGKPNRHLRGLLLKEPLPAGAELALEGRVVGRLTSSALSPVLGPIGLALLRREAEPGSLLSAPPSGSGAQVVELPFKGPIPPRQHD